MNHPDSPNASVPPADGWSRSESDPPAPVVVPEHQLLRQIGRGSYGEVWLARSQMGAFRAVKIVFRKSFESDRPFQRELSGIRKFEPVSRLHEGFVDILQVGINEEQGYFYYIMELGDDQASGQAINPVRYTPNTLGSEILRRGHLAFQECLQLGIAVTHALAELHKHGLVHRDIKPSNLIFVNGVPKLADIGLVAEVHEARSFVGTEGFIPPEGPGTAQADIYSFGKVLYEASTGRDRNDFPEMPTLWADSPEYRDLLELNEIILEACRINPADRYQSAWEMHSDLLVLLNGDSVKRLRILERRWKNIKRITGIAALSVGIAGIVSYQIYREWRANADTKQRQVQANVTYGTRAMKSGDLLGALPYFAEAVRLEPGNPDHRLRFGSALAQSPKLTHMWFAPRRLNEGHFSPDGKFVLFAQYYGQAEVYDLQTGRLVGHGFGPNSALRGATYSPDGQYIFTANESNEAILWDAQTQARLCDLPHTTRVLCGEFSPDGNLLVTAGKDGVARVWDVRTRTLKYQIAAHEQGILFAGFSHSGHLLVTASYDKTARIWRASDGEPALRPLPHPDWVTWAAFSADDRTLVTACDDHRARAWDVGSGARIRPDMLHNDLVLSVEYSPDGRLILTASVDRTARLWDAENLQPLGSNPILRHSDRLTHASFSPDGQMILTTAMDGTARVWDLAGAAVLPEAEYRSYCHDGSRFVMNTNGNFQVCASRDNRPVSPLIEAGLHVARIQLTDDGRFVLGISREPSGPEVTNHLVRVWRAEDGQPLGPWIRITNVLTAATVSDDGRHILVYGDTTAHLFDAVTGTLIPPSLRHDMPVTLASFNAQGTLFATLSATNAYVWRTSSRLLAYPPLPHSMPLQGAEFSLDGRYLLTCCSDPSFTACSAQVWDAKSGKPVGDALAHSDGVLSASFSRDALRVITASEDFTAKVWETLTGRQIGLPLEHMNQVNAGGFSPNGRWVATASADYTARVWDPESSEPLTPPLQHLGVVSGIKFVGDNRVVTTDREGRAYAWRLNVDTRPYTELTDLAGFLGVGQLVPNKPSLKRPTEPLSTVWNRLRAKFPNDFSTSTPEIERWHAYQVEASEKEEDWPAAVFHLEQLLKLKPGDASTTERLGKARQRVKRNE